MQKLRNWGGGVNYVGVQDRALKLYPVGLLSCEYSALNYVAVVFGGTKISNF